jgi:glycoside/pentoside/hexuronide:cation symporter, GPH family
MVMTKSSSVRTPGRSIFGFVVPGLPITMLGLPLLIYLPNFYANTVGISLSVVGMIFLIIRTADFLIDPYLGALMDRSQSRHGRFRAWFIGGMIGMFAGTGLLFFPPSWAGAGYLLFALSVLYIGYSTALLAQTAWGSTLTGDYHERSRIYGFWQATNVAGLLLSIIIPLVVGAAGYKTMTDSVHGIGLVILVLIPLTTIAILALTPDNAVRLAVAHRSAMATFRDTVALMRTKVIARIMAVDFFLSAAAGVTGALFLFYFRAVKGYSANEANLMLFAYFIGSLIGAPIWVWVARIAGKHQALLLAGLCYALAQASQIFLPKASAFTFIPWMLACGLPYAAITFLLRSMMADAVDLVKLDTGRDESGLLFGFLGSTNKLAYGIAVGVMYPLLQYVGFNAADGAQNSPDVLSGVTLLYVFPTAILVFAGLAALINYPLSAVEHSRVREKLGQTN